MALYKNGLGWGNTQFILRCMERYLHAAKVCTLQNANQLVWMYFSKTNDASPAINAIDAAEERMHLEMTRLGKVNVYRAIERFTKCARTALYEKNTPLEERMWHAIDDLVETDLITDAVLPRKNPNPADLIARVETEYRRLSPLSEGIAEPIHSARYKRR